MTQRDVPTAAFSLPSSPPSVSLPSPYAPHLPPSRSLLSEFTTNNVQFVRLSWADSAGIKIWISKEALEGAGRWEGEHQTEEEEEEEGDGEGGGWVTLCIYSASVFRSCWKLKLRLKAGDKRDPM